MDPFTCRQSIHGLTGLRRLEASTAGLASIIKKGGQKSDMGPLVCFRRRQTNAGGLVLHVHFKTSRFGVLVSLEHRLRSHCSQTLRWWSWRLVGVSEGVHHHSLARVAKCNFVHQKAKQKLLYVVVVPAQYWRSPHPPSKVPDKTQSPKRANHPLSSALPVPRASETKSLNGYGSVSFHSPVPMMYDRRWNGGAHLAWSVCHFSL
ncbi:hypothetical protein EDB86DRAFT_3243686 [Lactarius hatsudake]|nr:hypothetical protein EDB86DRAFT_3243686 [Lactarius hatsudake]